MLSNLTAEDLDPEDLPGNAEEQIPSDEELRDKAHELIAFFWMNAEQHLGKLTIPLFALHFGSRLTQVCIMRKIVEKDPRRRICVAHEEFGLSRSGVYKFVTDLGITTDTFRTFTSMDDLIQKSPILQKDARAIVHLHAKYIGSLPPQQLEDFRAQYAVNIFASSSEQAGSKDNQLQKFEQFQLPDDYTEWL